MKNARTVGVLVVSIALVYIASGCAVLRGGPSDEELLSKLLHSYEAAYKEGDVDKLISLYSKDYESVRGDSYEETVERLRQFVPRFAEWEVEISAAEAEIEIEGNTAKLSPITFESSRGTRSSTLVVTKEEDGVWRITSREMQREE